MIEPITFEKRDDFNRKHFADLLINLIKTNDEIFPLAINGSWGTGKTEFCMKTVYLINQEYGETLTATYFDAFSEDSYNQPLVSILAKLHQTFASEYDKRELKRHAINLALTATEVIAENINPAVGIFAKCTAKIANRISTQLREKAFERKLNIENSLNELKDFLTKLTQDKKLVLFIDELDRCRPDYALHLLEVIKHVFDIRNLKIIFIINSKQLIEIVKHNYGNNEEASKKYLDKFFHFQLNLPASTQKKNNDQILNSVIYLHIEFDRLKIFETPLFDEVNKNVSSTTKLLEELVEYYDLSLRDIEKLARNVSVYTALNKYKKDLLPGYKLLSVYAIFQFTFNGMMYKNCSELNVQFKQSDDLLPSIPKNAHAIPYRHILYLILFSTEEKFVNAFFGNWCSLHTLGKRRDYLINEFSTFKVFFAQ